MKHPVATRIFCLLVGSFRQRRLVRSCKQCCVTLLSAAHYYFVAVITFLAYKLFVVAAIAFRGFHQRYHFLLPAYFYLCVLLRNCKSNVNCIRLCCCTTLSVSWRMSAPLLLLRLWLSVLRCSLKCMASRGEFAAKTAPSNPARRTPWAYVRTTQTYMNTHIQQPINVCECLSMLWARKSNFCPALRIYFSCYMRAALCACVENLNNGNWPRHCISAPKRSKMHFSSQWIVRPSWRRHCAA